MEKLSRTYILSSRIEPVKAKPETKPVDIGPDEIESGKAEHVEIEQVDIEPNESQFWSTYSTYFCNTMHQYFVDQS